MSTVIQDELLADALDEESNPRRAWKVELACSRPEPRPRIAPFFAPSFITITESPRVIEHDLEEIWQ